MNISNEHVTMGSSEMVPFATEKDMEVRGPVGDWHALRSNPDYRADWRAHGGAPAVVDEAGFPLRVQTEADREAARWGLLAWEDPRERSRFKPFWIDEGMLRAEVGERGDPVGAIARASGMTVTGLRLFDGALVLKLKRWRRVEQIRVPEGDSFDLERTLLAIWYAFDGFPPTAAPRHGSAQAVQLHRDHGDAKETSTEAVGGLGNGHFEIDREEPREDRCPTARLPFRHRTRRGRLSGVSPAGLIGQSAPRRRLDGGTYLARRAIAMDPPAR